MAGFYIVSNSCRRHHQVYLSPTSPLKPSRNPLTGGLGLIMHAGPNLSFYANYNAVLPTDNTTDQTIQAGPRWRF